MRLSDLAPGNKTNRAKAAEGFPDVRNILVGYNQHFFHLTARRALVTRCIRRVTGAPRAMKRGGAERAPWRSAATWAPGASTSGLLGDRTPFVRSYLLDPYDNGSLFYRSMSTIDAKTRLCVLIGNPVEHSLSPEIHNAAFQHTGLNFVYLAFKVQDLEGAMRGIRALTGIRGISVTIPHKVAVLPYLDYIAPTAQNIGAVNTIVADAGSLSGYNTDASGALQALRAARCLPDEGRFLVLGSGGAARAISF